jgi:hypothetical protein
MGRFSSMQFAIDTALEFYVKARLPSLGPFLNKEFLTRIRDDQRLPAFLAFAQDSGYSQDLSLVTPLYRRAKQTRDYVGHSLGVSVFPPPKGQAAKVNVVALSKSKRTLVPEPLVPETFDRLTNDCEWIEEHALRALYEAGVTEFRDLTGTQPYEPPIPPATPVNGEPLE